MVSRGLARILLLYLATLLSTFLYKLSTGYYDSVFTTPLFSNESLFPSFLSHLRPSLDPLADYLFDLLSSPFATPENRALFQAFNLIFHATNLWRCTFPERLPTIRRFCVSVVVFVCYGVVCSFFLWKFSEIHDDNTSGYRQVIPSLVLEYANIFVTWATVDAATLKIRVALFGMACGFVSFIHCLVVLFLNREEFYKELEDLERENERLRLENDELRRQIEALQRQIELRNQVIADLRRQNRALRRDLRQWRALTQCAAAA